MRPAEVEGMREGQRGTWMAPRSSLRRVPLCEPLWLLEQVIPNQRRCVISQPWRSEPSRSPRGRAELCSSWRLPEERAPASPRSRGCRAAPSQRSGPLLRVPLPLLGYSRCPGACLEDPGLPPISRAAVWQPSSPSASELIHPQAPRVRACTSLGALFCNPPL